MKHCLPMRVACSRTFVLQLVLWFPCLLLRAQQPPVTDLVSTRDGRAVLSVSQLGLREFSWPDLKTKRRIAVQTANLHCAAFSPSGRMLAIGGGDPAEDGIVSLYTWPAGKLTATIRGHADSVMDVAWIDDETLCSASMDRTIKLWRIDALEAPRMTLVGHSRSIHALCLLPDRKTLVSAGADHSLRVWNVATGELLRSLNQHTMPVHSLALRPTTSGLPMVASASADRSIRFWQPTIGRMVRYIRLEAEPLDISWLPDGQRIAAACTDGHVRVVNADTVTLLQDIPAITGWAYAIAAHPDGKSIMVGGTNGIVRKVVVESRKDGADLSESRVPIR